MARWEQREFQTTRPVDQDDAADRLNGHYPGWAFALRVMDRTVRIRAITWEGIDEAIVQLALDSAVAPETQDVKRLRRLEPWERALWATMLDLVNESRVAQGLPPITVAQFRQRTMATLSE